MPLDESRLNAFIGQVLGDLGGAVSIPLVRIGDALGLYAALDRIGPATPEATRFAGPGMKPAVGER